MIGDQPFRAIFRDQHHPVARLQAQPFQAAGQGAGRWVGPHVVNDDEGGAGVVAGGAHGEPAQEGGEQQEAGDGHRDGHEVAPTCSGDEYGDEYGDGDDDGDGDGDGEPSAWRECDADGCATESDTDSHYSHLRKRAPHPPGCAGLGAPDQITEADHYRPLRDGELVVFLDQQCPGVVLQGPAASSSAQAKSRRAWVRAVVTRDTPVSRILAHCAAEIPRTLAATAAHEACDSAGARAGGGLLLMYGASQVAPADATIGSLGVAGGDVLRIVPQCQ